MVLVTVFNARHMKAFYDSFWLQGTCFVLTMVIVLADGFYVSCFWPNPFRFWLCINCSIFILAFITISTLTLLDACLEWHLMCKKSHCNSSQKFTFEEPGLIWSNWKKFSSWTKFKSSSTVTSICSIVAITHVITVNFQAESNSTTAPTSTTSSAPSGLWQSYCSP